MHLTPRMSLVRSFELSKLRHDFAYDIPWHVVQIRRESAHLAYCTVG